MWALKPNLPLPQEGIHICRNSCGHGPPHAYGKHFRRWDQDKVVGVQKTKRTSYRALVPGHKAASELTYLQIMFHIITYKCAQMNLVHGEKILLLSKHLS